MTTTTNNNRTTTPSHRSNQMTNSGRLTSDQGSAGVIVAIGLGLLALVWSYGWLAPISSAVPGAADYENEAGNDFINGFKEGYANQTNPTQQQRPEEVAQS